MRWLVGIDSRNLSAGAASLARWCSARSPVDTFIGVHVIEQAASELAAEMEPPTHAAALHRMAESALDPLRAESTFRELLVVEATSIEEGLERAADEHDAHAFVLGRRKPSAQDAVLRLGRVARRVLRRLPRPVVIVPPDLRGHMISGGPIVIGVDLSSTCNGAVAFGRLLARTLELELVAAHAVGMPGSLEPLLPAASWDERVQARRAMGATDLDAWCFEHGLGDARRIVTHGSPTSQLIDVAGNTDASMIIVGSRGLGTFDRLFESSVGSELAASAPISVAVVPSEWTAPAARPRQPIRP
jgi:nucleotide-binding universal stress UspA family protein